jgi:hypothetical protein
MDRWLALVLVAANATAGCRDDATAPARPARMAAPVRTAATAARTGRPRAPATTPPDAGIADAGVADSLSGAGSASGGFFDAFLPRPGSPAPQRRHLELTLRSTPAGAIAAVDGLVIGPTPTFWTGKVTGRPREFTFALDGYALARYRFVPVQDGVVHATLKPEVRVEVPPRDVPAAGAASAAAARPSRDLPAADAASAAAARPPRDVPDAGSAAPAVAR